MSDSHSNQQQIIDDQLVAYLDGELDATESKRIEEQLGSDAAYQSRLRLLQKTWDALDKLPSTTVDEQFTRSTVEMVAVAARKEINHLEKEIPKQQRTRTVLLFGSCLFALLCSFAVVSLAWPDPNEQLLEQLPLIQDLDLYIQGSDIEFVRMLANKNFAASDSERAASRDSAFSAATLSIGSQADTIAARRAWLAGLAPSEQAKLDRSYKRFEQLSRSEQQRLIQLQTEIARDPAREQLLAALHRYYHWVLELEPSQRFELLSLSPQERYQLALKIETDHERRRSGFLSAADREAYANWLQNFILRRRDEIMQRLPRSMHTEISTWMETQPDRKQSYVLLLILRSKFKNGRSRELPPPTPEENRELLASLSEKAKKQIELSKRQNREGLLMRRWMFSAMLNFRPDMNSQKKQKISNEDLEQFFASDKLTPAEREDLLEKDVDVMQRELRYRYLYGNNQDVPAWFSRLQGYSRSRFEKNTDKEGSENRSPNQRPRFHGPPHSRHRGERDRRPRPDDSIPAGEVDRPPHTGKFRPPTPGGPPPARPDNRLRPSHDSNDFRREQAPVRPGPGGSDEIPPTSDSRSEERRPRK